MATSTVPDLVTPTWEYAPAPEARDIVTIRSTYGLFIGGRWVDTVDGSSFKTINPATEEVLAEVQSASAGRCRQSGEGGAHRVHAVVTTHGASAASTSIASLVSCRSGRVSSPVLESLDNGKPIKESRDVDLPLVAAHFFYYAGWADKLD